MKIQPGYPPLNKTVQRSDTTPRQAPAQTFGDFMQHQEEGRSMEELQRKLEDIRLQGDRLMRFDDDASTVQALISGQVDAIGAAVTQVGNLAQVAGPGKYEARLVLSRVYDGVAVRPGEREWVDYLNGLIGRKLADGELPALYRKWIGKDLPANMPDTGEGDAPLPVVVTR